MHLVEPLHDLGVPSSIYDLHCCFKLVLAFIFGVHWRVPTLSVIEQTVCQHTSCRK